MDLVRLAGQVSAATTTGGVSAANTCLAGSIVTTGGEAGAAQPRSAAPTQILHGSPDACAARSNGCTNANVSTASNTHASATCSADRKVAALERRDRMGAVICRTNL